MKPTTSALTKAERKWIGEQIVGAAQFVEAFSPEDADATLTLAALDRAFAVWLAIGNSDDQAINAAINAVGVAFGQSLVDGAGFEWVIATDDIGTEIAILALPGAGDVLVFPTNFVAKRWERCESEFLQDSYAAIVDQVQAVREEHAAARTAKPWWKLW